MVQDRDGQAGRTGRAVTYMGEHAVGHDWAYLPDLAETFARIAERERELPNFDSFHFEGYWFERGVEIARAVGRAAGKPALPIKRFPWFVVYALAPVVPLFREMIEMRYLWKRPLRLDNAKLVAFLGGEPRTDLDEALRATLAGSGCLPGASAGHLSLKSRVRMGARPLPIGADNHRFPPTGCSSAW